MTDEEAELQLMARRQRSMNTIQRQIERKEKQIKKKNSEKKKGKIWKIFKRDRKFLVSKRKGKVKTKGFTTKLVQLYNIEEDPTEKKELSDSHPKLVNIMLTKLADYYVSDYS